MREAAEAALAQFGITDAAARLVTHDYNTTFRVDCERGRFALRIAMNSERTLDEVAAEMAWQQALALDTDLTVAEPAATCGGALVAEVSVAGLGDAQPAVLCRWLEGRAVGDSMSKRQARMLGRLAATIDTPGATWGPPPATRRLDAVMMDAPDRMELAQQWATPAEWALLVEARATVTELIAPVLAGPLQLIHADLHPFNVKWEHGAMSVFDFNDFGLGTVAQELAIAAYYLRDMPAQEAELIAGYDEVAALPDVSPHQFEALLAARNLLLCSDLLRSVTDYDPEFVASYVSRTVARQRHFLDQSVFSLDPEPAN